MTYIRDFKWHSEHGSCVHCILGPTCNVKCTLHFWFPAAGTCDLYITAEKAVKLDIVPSEFGVIALLNKLASLV